MSESKRPFIKQPEFFKFEARDGSVVFEAVTPVGTFRYGCDNTGQHYWQDASVGCVGYDVGDMTTAERLAEESYFDAVRSHPVAALLQCPSNPS